MTDSVVIPRPVQLVIDDVGWREGWNVSEGGGPYRAGVDRLLGPADYHVVADIGERLTVRPQCAMVLCEWDTENVCAEYPTATHAGPDWDNSARIGDWVHESADVFRDRAAHIELAMHGVGHEHWENGVRTRAEWLGPAPDQRWPTDILEGHLECFRRILAQHGLGPEHGVSFPRSFVPCAFRFLWHNADPESTGALVARAGVRYASTPFSTCCFVDDEPDRPDGGLEHGVLVLDRGSSGVPWHVYDTVPEALTENAICGIHWPNVLRPEPAENGIAVDRWVRFLDEIDRGPDAMLARNMAETCSQWLYWHYASLRPAGASEWVLDISGIPAEARRRGLVMPLILKIRPSSSRPSLTIRSETCRAVASWRASGWEYLVVDVASGAEHRFALEPADGNGDPVVKRRGTYDVLGVDPTDTGWRVMLRIYGRQAIHVRLPTAPRDVRCSTPGVAVSNTAFDAHAGILEAAVATKNIQGHEVELHVAT